MLPSLSFLPDKTVFAVPKTTWPSVVYWFASSTLHHLLMICNKLSISHFSFVLFKNCIVEICKKFSILLCDKTMVVHYDPLYKRDFVEWQWKGELILKNAKFASSSKHIIAPIFWDSKGFFNRFLRAVVNSEYYADWVEHNFCLSTYLWHSFNFQSWLSRMRIFCVGPSTL